MSTSIAHTPMPALPPLTWQNVWNWLDGAPIRIVATLLIAVLARWLLHRIIRRAIDVAIAAGQDPGRAGRAWAHATGWSQERHRQRLRTLNSLLRSIVTFVITLVTVLTIMSLAGIPLAPLLASAGVGGVALGFGAQSLVKDFLSGIFMIIEDQYGVGDVIDTGTAVGTVTEVSLRITTLRDANGVTWHIRNGEILAIGNRSQGWATALVDLPIAYDSDPDRALRVLRESVDAFAADEQWAARLVEPPAVLGVSAITGGSMTLQILAKCRPGEEFAVARELRLRGKDALAHAGIPGPPITYPPDGSPT